MSEAVAELVGPRSTGAPDRFMRGLLRVDHTDRAALTGARSAFGRSVIISGIRCLITYLIIPIGSAVGLIGTAARPLSLLLCVAGIYFSVTSSRRFWLADHRYRWHYTAFAGIIVSYLSFGFVSDSLALLGLVD